MLIKLIKHEIEAIGKIFAVLYVATIAMAIVNKVIATYIDSVYSSERYDSFANSSVDIAEIFQSIAAFVLMALFIAIFVITLVVMIQRFHKNLLGDEGYLMFTLPVKTNTLILSKFLTSILFQITSVICAIIVAFILTGTNVINVFKDIFLELNLGWNHLVGLPNAFEILVIIISVLLFLLVTWLSFTLLVYFCLAIGHLFNKHKILMAIITFFVVTVGIQILLAILGTSFFDMLVGYYDIYSSGYYAMVFPILMIVYSVLIYLVTYKILSKRLNIT